MEEYWKAAGAVLIVLILGQAQKEKEMAAMLAIALCAMIGILLSRYLKPIFEFLETLQKMGDIQGNMLGILLKVMGIGVVTEITEMVCKDFGNASLGHALQMLGTAVTLWLSLPIFTTVLRLLQEIMGGI